jgi:hypothetical protein
MAEDGGTRLGIRYPPHGIAWLAWKAAQRAKAEKEDCPKEDHRSAKDRLGKIFSSTVWPIASLGSTFPLFRNASSRI